MSYPIVENEFDRYYRQFDEDFAAGQQARLDKQWEEMNRQSEVSKTDIEMQEVFASLSDEEID